MSALRDRLPVPGRRRGWRQLALAGLATLAVGCGLSPDELADLGLPPEQSAPTTSSPAEYGEVDVAATRRLLRALPVKGRAAATGYSRDRFGPEWADVDADQCDTRNQLLQDTLVAVRLQPGSRCVVLEGDLTDPYTGREVHFVYGGAYINAVDVDHVVSLRDAWVKGAQQLTARRREALANDPLNLQAVAARTNRQKGPRDAASWLPPNKAYRCRYVSRQVQVKVTYRLWVTRAERDAVLRVLRSCGTRTR